MFFFWYSISIYIEITSLYNQTSNPFLFLIYAIIKTIGILSLFSCIEFLPKDIWHKHLSYEIKLSIKWLACIISCSNELICNHDHLEQPILPEAPKNVNCWTKTTYILYSITIPCTPITYEIKFLIKTMFNRK